MKISIITLTIALLSLTSCGSSNNEGAASGNTVETAESMRTKEWKPISPKEIEGNFIQMVSDEWFELAAGKENDINLMTIAWGSIGQLWGKPVITVYVSTNRYTYGYMERNDYFTLTHYHASMREQLQYLGSVSGRDEDKVKGASLTKEFTQLGNPIFSEADLAIECKKLYSEQFKADLMPVEQRQWYEDRGIGIHVAYVGEIINVWKK